jgi:hypothetical protein
LIRNLTHNVSSISFLISRAQSCNPSLLRRSPTIHFKTKGEVDMSRIYAHEEIADILTYIRSNFGNKASVVTATDVKNVRTVTKLD